MKLYSFPQNKALDLSKFHASIQFLGDSVYLPLNRYNVLTEVSEQKTH